MYKRLSMVLFPFALLAFVGAGVWGYLEHQEKNSILIKAENQYQRAFHDLSFHVDKLHTELGNTLAVNSTSSDSYRKGLVNVWRITSQAQNEINQLPLTLLPFNKTEEFLANMSNFSYRTAVRDLSKSPLNEEEVKTLNTLYEHSKEITDDLRGVQTKVLSNHLRWMDVETALATEKEPLDNAIIDGFKTVDKKVSEYSEINFGPTTPSIFRKRNVEALSGNIMTTQEITQKAAQFLNKPDLPGAKVVENGQEGTEYQSFSVTVPGSNKTNDMQLDFTKKGGQLIYFMNSRNVPERKLDIRQARDIANEFLDQHNYKDMSAVSFDEYQNSANFTFARRINDVIIYPEKVSIEVALDNGEITSLHANDYVFEHKERQIKTPKISSAEARKMLNPKMEISKERLALIHNDLDEEVLCYEFIGKLNKNNFRIYVNGDTGVEEKIETIKQEEAQTIAK